MPNAVTRYLQRRKYGADVVVVSGLPRSGTSMMMKMLEAGGLSIVTDGVRSADEDNPKGYFEHERVKNLEKDPDKSWLRDARGHAIKVISHLLKELPDDCFYRVIFMRRDLSEIVASQNTMLERRGEEKGAEDDRIVELYRKHIIHAKVLMRERPNFELLEIQYTQALANPPGVAARVNEFLEKRLDEPAMPAAVDPTLRRNKA